MEAHRGAAADRHRREPARDRDGRAPACRQTAGRVRRYAPGGSDVQRSDSAPRRREACADIVPRVLATPAGTPPAAIQRLHEALNKGLAKKDVGVLLAILVAGLGAGSVLAGWWSGGKVELGIVPLGTLVSIVSSLLLFLSGGRVDPTLPAMEQAAFWWACVWLFGLGAGAGLFNIPLETYLQHRSDERTRGEDNQQCQRHVEHMLGVVVRGIAGVVIGMRAVIQAGHVLERTLDLGRCRAGVEAEVQAHGLGADRRGVGGADLVGDVVIAASHAGNSSASAARRYRLEILSRSSFILWAVDARWLQSRPKSPAFPTPRPAPAWRPGNRP